MTHDPNPYAPPELLDDPVAEVDDSEVPKLPPGVLICPWCRQRVPFRMVYWSSTSKIACPHCGQIFQRKKRGLARGVSEVSLIVSFCSITLAVAWLTQSALWSCVSMIITLPLLYLADSHIDRQLAYLVKSKHGRRRW